MRIRRGSTVVVAGELDKLSPEDKEKLLDKVKEKLLADMDKGGDSGGNPGEQPEDKVEDSLVESEDEGIVQEKQDKVKKMTKKVEKPEKKQEKTDKNIDNVPKSVPVIRLRRGANSTGCGIKDRDVMSDTGGAGKHKVAPDFKPSRADSSKIVTDKKLTKETRADNFDTVGDPDLKS